MKKFFFFFFFFLFLFPLVLASTEIESLCSSDSTFASFSNLCSDTKGLTIIGGKVFDSFTNKSVGNAEITVVCNHNGIDYTKTTKSIKSGRLKGYYEVTFLQSKCDARDEVTVTVTSDELSGSNSGIVGKTCKNWLDVAIINVPLVPEFGTVVGIVTLIGALGIFFFVRK